MRRGLIVLAVALALAGAARAAPPSVDARAYVVVNATNGTVLAQSHAHEELAVASITKLMTVIVALQHLSPGDDVKVSAQAARVGEERIPLRAGQTVSVHDLLEGALIQSANDAADALAAAAAGGNIAQFVDWMNEEAQTLGLHDTHFVRPDGLDAPGHVSSAHDVAILAETAMESATVRDIVRKRSDTIEDGTVPLHTWNDLLGVFPGLIGVKTGHTDDAGWCEVAAASRPGFTIYAVILGSPTRAQRNSDLDRLLAWGVSRFKRVTLVGREPVTRVALPYGRLPLALVASRPLVKLVPVGRPIVERVVAPSSVTLPVRRGQTLGRIDVWSGTRLLGSRPLQASRSVPRPGMGGRLRWYATRTVKDLWGFIS
ncbi:MAG TPA: D-alanyl-D-alanine carboxypeptidase family protein [Gaiellaceae bacterium]|nr:D-alanyl-D-alanine carboxypeptidase family protein [Gaiellaceae bacterium]